MAEVLGTLRCPTGDLLVVDFGTSKLWSGEGPPLLDVADGFHPEMVDRANSAHDYEIVGPQATDVAQALDLAVVKGRYAFDLAPTADLADRVAAISRQDGLAVRVEQRPRLPHAERVRRLLADAPAAEVPFHGMWGVAVRGLPNDRDLRVLGRWMDPDGPDAGRWQSIWVEVSDAPVVRSEEAGHVLVDEARLLLVDPSLYAQWNAEPADVHHADVVVWGRDAAAVAARFSLTPHVEPGDHEQWGRLGMEFTEALVLARAIDDLRQEGDHKFALDFRPHDDDHRILGPMRQSRTGSATVDLAGFATCGFWTTWGDGAFPVYLDLSADGSLVAVRIELGAPEIVRRTRRFEDLWFGELSLLALVSPAVWVDGREPRWMYRDDPNNDRDSGWRVFSGDESEEQLATEQVSLVPLRELVGRWPDLEDMFRVPPSVAFERVDGQPWRRLDGYRS